MRKTHSTNIELQDMIIELQKASKSGEVRLWKRVASDLSKPTRQRRLVNLSRINRCTSDNDTIVVPGKVLSLGDIDHKVTVAAFTFSQAAREKIESAKGQAITIPELVKSHPKGEKVKIIG